VPLSEKPPEAVPLALLLNNLNTPSRHWFRNKARFLYSVPFLQIVFQGGIEKAVEAVRRFLNNAPVDMDHGK
jgi:hypothetical protein